MHAELLMTQEVTFRLNEKMNDLKTQIGSLLEGTGAFTAALSSEISERSVGWPGSSLSRRSISEGATEVSTNDDGVPMLLPKGGGGEAAMATAAGCCGSWIGAACCCVSFLCHSANSPKSTKPEESESACRNCSFWIGERRRTG